MDPRAGLNVLWKETASFTYRELNNFWFVQPGAYLLQKLGTGSVDIRKKETLFTTTCSVSALRLIYGCSCAKWQKHRGASRQHAKCDYTCSCQLAQNLAWQAIRCKRRTLTVHAINANGQWKYGSTHSEPRHYMELIGQFHNSTD